MFLEEGSENNSIVDVCGDNCASFNLTVLSFVRVWKHEVKASKQ
jgi:hypothetical protein